MNEDWPVAGFDPVRRLRVLAAATPGSAMTELTIPAPPELVWRVASDLSTEMPRLVRDFRSVTVSPVPEGAPGTGERLIMDARGYLGQRARFDVIMRPGWCWMQSRFLVGGMAAAPEQGGTRFAFLGGIRAAGVPVPSSVLRLFRAAIRLDHLQADIQRQLSGQ